MSNKFPQLQIKPLEPLQLTAPPGSQYRWKKDGLYLDEAAPRVIGAHSHQLAFEYLMYEDAGVYIVEYDDGDGKAITQTEPYELTVAERSAVPALAPRSVIVLTLLLAAAYMATQRRRKKDFT